MCIVLLWKTHFEVSVDCYHIVGLLAGWLLLVGLSDSIRRIHFIYSIAIRWHERLDDDGH